MTTTYYIEQARGGLTPATPARIVCYDEGDGEWTIDAEDADGRCIRDEAGNYPASIWCNSENDFEPMTRDEAVAAAAALAREIGLPTLPVYVWSGGERVPVAGGAA